MSAGDVVSRARAWRDDDPDPETRAKLKELAWLENSIGATGMLAMAPFLRHSSRETWQRSLLRP